MSLKQIAGDHDEIEENVEGEKSLANTARSLDATRKREGILMCSSRTWPEAEQR